MPDDERPIADKLRGLLGSELAGGGADPETRKRDLAARITALRAQLRGGPLTDGRLPTAEGHISSAISLLQRELDALYFSRR